MKFTKLTVLTVVLVSALALTGCGKKDKGNGVASAGDNKNASDTSTDPQEQMRKFAQCMRDNGIDMPDPTFQDGANGGFSVQVGPGKAADDNDPNAKANAKEDMQKFEAAQKACEKYMPKGGDLNGKADPEMEEKMRQFAKCMRDNGVENFPDPQEGGGMIIQGGGPGSDNGLNPNDPTFKAAEEKCRSILPAPKDGGPSTTTSGA